MTAANSEAIVPVHRLRRAPGQTVVIFALSLVALLAMAGLVVDGGNAYAQQRATQNGADAAAEAGATQLARRLAGVSDPNWDGTILASLAKSAQANGLATPLAFARYTDLKGNDLSDVGSGIPTAAAGVHVAGRRTFGTTLARVVGLNEFTATAEATAIAGYSSGVGRGGVIPVTFPVLLTTCDGSGDQAFPPGGQAWPVGPTLAVPLCKNSPGNVGWIDWTPPAGGASELANSIANSNNPPITTPKWYYITSTGNVNSGQVQNALDSLDNTDVLIPIFYASATDPLPGTCSSTPSGDQTLLSQCPTADRGGNGSNQWYYLVTFASFHLDHAYVQGSHSAECNAPGLLTVSGGNGGTSCLIGHFNGPVVESNMTVGSGPGSSPVPYLTPITTQLIK